MGIAWELSFELWPAGQEGDMVCLWAGLEENVVEIYAAGRLPRGRIMVEDEALYQLLRTSRDGLPRVEDESYADYKWAVDDYYDARVADMNQLLAESGLDWRVAGWELGTFHLVGENTEAGTQAYLMADLWYTDPPEKVCNMLTGGAYVDSLLRLAADLSGGGGRPGRGGVLPVRGTEYGAVPHQAGLFGYDGGKSGGVRG